VALRRIREVVWSALAFSLGSTRGMFGSEGGLWDVPASRLGLRDVAGVIGGHRDVLESGGRPWDMPALRLGSTNVVGIVARRDAFGCGGWVLGTLWAPEMCLGVGAGSGMC
jgi:hypothetical protein